LQFLPSVDFFSRFPLFPLGHSTLHFAEIQVNFSILPQLPEVNCRKKGVSLFSFRDSGRVNLIVSALHGGGTFGEQRFADITVTLQTARKMLFFDGIYGIFRM